MVQNYLDLCVAILGVYYEIREADIYIEYYRKGDLVEYETLVWHK